MERERESGERERRERYEMLGVLVHQIFPY